MKTVIIEIKDPKALGMLKEMEKLHWISMKNKLNVTNKNTSKLSTRLAGKLSSETAKQLEAHVSKSRDQWNRSF